MALLLAGTALAALASADRGVQARTGDKLTAEVGVARDTDVFTVELAAGATLDVGVKAAKKTPLLPTLRVLAPDGSEVTPPKGVKGAGKASIKFKKLIAPPGTTGVWRVIVAGNGETTGGYTASFKVGQPKPPRVKGLAVPAGGEARVSFAAEDDATVSVAIKPGKGGARLVGAHLVGPGGEEIPGSADAFELTKKGLKLKKLPVSAGFGSYGVVLEGGAAPTTAAVKVKVKFPSFTKRKTSKKVQTGLLPPELELVAVTDGDVRQDDVAARLEVTGAHFLARTTAVVSGVGVSVDGVSVTGADTLAVDVTVASDAPYGRRDLTIVPPPLLGESKTLVDAVQVLAPLPRISAASPPIVKQNDAVATVVVAGVGFRDGGHIDIAGPGVTLTGIVVDSDAQLTLTLRVSNFATIGPRDVTYTQPAAGGGDAVTAVGLLRVNYPDPVVVAAAPAIVKQGQSDAAVTLSGAGYRNGTTALVSGSGVTVRLPNRFTDSSFGVTLDVDVDAPYGARDVTLTQPADGGGAAGVGEGVLTVHAPDPVVTSISPGSVTQGDSNVLITLMGEEFRDDASVTLTGSGLTVSNYERVSDTQVTFRVTVDDDAALGEQSLTYTQPVAGGGAAASLNDVLQVDAPTPTASAISVTMAKQLDVGVEITLTGGEFRAGGTISFSGGSLTVGATTIDSRTSARVTIDVAEFAAVGDRDVIFTQPAVGGARSVTLTDALTIHHPDPTVTSVDPGRVRRTKSGVMRVVGAGFRDGGTITTDATDVTFGSPTVVSVTAIDVTYDVAVDATLTGRDVIYTQPAAGGAAATTLIDGFEVFGPPPVFTSISPARLRPGDGFVPCVILGDRFVSGTTVSFGNAGVVVEDIDVTSATRLDLVLSVTSTASLGATDLLIHLPEGPAEVFGDAFTVIPADPSITAFSHATLARGSDGVEVEVHGANFLAGDTLSASGSGVTFSVVSVESPTLITAEVNVASGATLGARDLSVAHSAATGARSVMRAGAFDVIATGPTVTAVNPSTIAHTAQGGRTRKVTAYVTGSNFMSGATVSVAKASGSGLSVVTGGVRVLSDTELEVQLSVAAAATTGTWDLKVANPGSAGDSGSTGDDVIDVKTELVLTVNQVVPATGSTYGGERIVVHGGGFVVGSVVDFGTERAYRVQVIDDNTLICTVPQPSTASQTGPTEVTVKVTTPSSANASRTEGYAYAKDTQTMFVESSFPSHGATGVPATIARCCLRLSSPVGTPLPAYGKLSSAWPERSFVWNENGAASVPSGAVSLGPHGRWIVYTRATTSPLPATHSVFPGLYKMNVPGTIVALSGRDFVEVNRVGDAAEVNYDEYRFTITTSLSDTTAPTMSSSTPAASASNVSTTAPITLVMSEELDPLTLTTTNITFKQASTPVGFHLGIGDDLRTLTLSPHAELKTSTNYTVTMTTGVKDLHGNAVAANIVRAFTTSSGTDTRAPTIDDVIIEGLPASVDGSGTFVAGVDSTGSSGNPQAAAPGASTNFDLYLPRSGFELRVEYSDDGGVGIDESKFSAKCSVAVGSTSANTELAAKFDVNSVRAVWRIPSTSLVTAGENVTFTFSIKDMNGNTSTAKTITVDVIASGATSSASAGGNLDPFDSRQTWVLRADLDQYTSTYYEETVNSITYPRMTTTNVANDVNDFDEGLILVGLATDSMTTASAAATNGPSVGTNQIMRRLVLERIRELTRARFGIDADGVRDGDAPQIEFLLQGEQGSLSSRPSYSSTYSSSSSNGYSEISVCGTKGAESNGATTARIDSAAVFDARNLNQESLVNTDGTYGVFLTSMMKLRLIDGRYDKTGTSQSWRGMVRIFGRNVLQDFSGTWGGTPIGEHASDDDVLSGSFDRTTSTNTTHKDRYDAIETAIETIALWASSNVAMEIATASGLVPDGGPKTGLFGHAHRNNTFTDATTSALNVTHRIRWAAMNNLMAPAGTLFEKIRTGSDMRRFNPLAMAWLRQRVLYDEGQ